MNRSPSLTPWQIIKKIEMKKRWLIKGKRAQYTLIKKNERFLSAILKKDQMSRDFFK